MKNLKINTDNSKKKDNIIALNHVVLESKSTLKYQIFSSTLILLKYLNS